MARVRAYDERSWQSERRTGSAACALDSEWKKAPRPECDSAASSGLAASVRSRMASERSRSIVDAESVSEVFENAGHRDRDVEGRIVLATGDGLRPYWIAPRLPQFQAMNPKVQLRMRVVDRVPDLMEGEADIAIQFTEPKSPEIIGRKLGVLHYMSFASEAYLEEVGQLPNSLFEYYRYKTILHEGYVHQIKRWAPRVAELKKMIDYSLVTNSAAAMIEVCANGGGIAVLPSYLGEVDNRLQPLNLPEIAPIQFWLTYTERVRRLPQGQAVLDWLWTIFDERRIAWFRDAFVHPAQIMRGAESQIARTF